MNQEKLNRYCYDLRMTLSVARGALGKHEQSTGPLPDDLATVRYHLADAVDIITSLEHGDTKYADESDGYLSDRLGFGYPGSWADGPA